MDAAAKPLVAHSRVLVYTPPPPVTEQPSPAAEANGSLIPGSDVAGDPAANLIQGWSQGEAVKKSLIRIAAIDNGLAFPFKHPDEWRACESLVPLIPEQLLTPSLTRRSVLLGLASLRQSALLT